MRFGQIYKFAATAVATAAAMVATLLSGCLRDEGASRRNDKPAGPIEFQMSVIESEPIRTRLDSAYVSTTYDVDFVIELNTNEDKAPKGPIKETQLYTVPSGYEGRLTAKQNMDPLNWRNLTEKHTFYSWTNSWLPAKDENGEPTVYPDYPTYDSDIPEEYGGTDDNGKFFWVTFHDSPEDRKETDDSTGNNGTGNNANGGDEEEKVPGFNVYHNNDYLEKFIGTKAGPYSYVEHGRYVMLTFKHLVSKIRIDRMGLLKPDGSIDYAVRGDMTFIGMPKRAKFYPHPNDGVSPPYVEHNKDDDEYKDKKENYDVTYFIENKAGEKDYFYICPEVDFKTIGFKINLNDEQYGNEGNYYGDFKEVQFVREAGTDYDQGGDDTILHAGEEMTLSIMLVPGVGPGIALIIQDWSTEDPESTVHHTKPGIYTDSEVNEVLDAFLKQKNNGEGTTPEEIERLYEMYGEERDIDGNGTKEKCFPLYDNVDISGTKDGNIFPFPKDYILDGMGHTIFMRTNYGGKNNGDFDGVDKTYYNIGPARDVWLADANGNNKIYIDKDGVVWYYDSDGNFLEGGQLEPLDGNYKSYDISVDGKVHRSTYYNNNIVGS